MSPNDKSERQHAIERIAANLKYTDESKIIAAKEAAWRAGGEFVPPAFPDYIALAETLLDDEIVLEASKRVLTKLGVVL